MSTEKQIAANQANSQHSTGPKTDEGKAKSCLNNFHWGFCGTFKVLPSEDQENFDTMLAGLRVEHKPTTMTETLLVNKMAQHYWLSQRAMRLQEMTMAEDLPAREQERDFALYLRYQTTNDRAFKCLNDLLKLRAEQRKAQIGFESQRRQQEDHARKLSIEKRKQDVHKMDILLAEAKADHQLLPNFQLEFAQKKQMAA
ncbi:MAG: hypothetical protein JOZ48_13290 [Acidobacteriaceae bacterium]|nr:hypothetical protein [Acidobacteriaceae bacterium]